MTIGKTPEQRLDNLEAGMGKLIDVIDALGKQLQSGAAGKPAKKAVFGEHRGRVAVLDTKTLITYPSQANLTKNVGPEFGIAPTDHFGCYAIYNKAPGRFKVLSGPEAEAAWKAADDKIKAEVEAANAKLAAQKAAADAAAAVAGTTAAAAPVTPATATSPAGTAAAEVDAATKLAAEKAKLSGKKK
jgi:hypothetical protein